MKPPELRNPNNPNDFAKCSDGDPDAMFVMGKEQNQAKKTCRTCLARVACLVYALENGEEFGVWGGMTDRQRRKLRRQVPNGYPWHDAMRTELDAEQTEREALVAKAKALARPAAKVAVG